LLTLFGLLMIVCFIAVIMTHRLSAMVALILMPLIFGVMAGHSAEVGKMAIDGIAKLAPTAVLLMFAVLYFAIMIDAGLFDPLVRRVVRLVGGDPLRICIGTSIVVLIVSLDGDGASTALLTVATFLPIYYRVGMNPLILAVLLGAANSIVNLTPWGGPAGRVAAALHVDAAEVFLPLIPTMLVCMAATFMLAVHFGMRERRRLGIGHGAAQQPELEPVPSPDAGLTRPRLVYLNLALTIAVLALGFTRRLPLPIAFMAGSAVALLINYPRVETQRQRVAAYAENVLPVALLIFGAGVFTGVMTGTGMIDALAQSAALLLPDAMGPRIGWLLAFLAGPLTFMLPNDAYYFGVVPVIAKTAAQFGVAALDIARASLLGQPLHTLSPLYASIYLAATLLRTEVGTMQRFAFPWLLLLTGVMAVAAILTGAVR
jgi:CitMHS family citrate-Mg2+:H+ or citrate-Ca2+:H+ symporter